MQSTGKLEKSNKFNNKKRKEKRKGFEILARALTTEEPKTYLSSFQVYAQNAIEWSPPFSDSITSCEL